MTRHISAPKTWLILSIFVLTLTIPYSAHAALTKDRNWVDDRIKMFQQEHTPQLEVQMEVPAEPRLYSDKFSQTFQTFRHEERVKGSSQSASEAPDPVRSGEEPSSSELNQMDESDEQHELHEHVSHDRVAVFTVPPRQHQTERVSAKPYVRNMSDRPTLAELKAERKRIRAVLLNGNGIFLRNSHITGEHTWGRKWKWWSKIY